MTFQALGECASLAFAALRTDKLKSFLTILSVTIGSASIVLVITAAATGKAFILSRIEGIGSNVAFATLNRDLAPTTLEDELTSGDLVAVRASLPMAVAAAGTYDWPIDYHWNGKIGHARLVGVSPEFLEIRKLKVTSGRYFDREDFRSRAHVCLVTDRIAQAASLHHSAIGSSLRMEDFRCVVIGTFEEGVPTFGQSEIQPETVLVPFPLVQPITGDNYFQVIYVQADSSSEVPAMTEELAHLLKSRHRPQATYDVQNLTSILEIGENVSLAMYIVLLATGVVTLIVGGTGIMNIMLANIAERKHEIGIRKALGARPAEIRLQFLLEAATISLTGAISGVVVALLLILWSASWIRSMIAVHLSWPAIVVALLLTTTIGILFGYQPASKAATLNPVEALRADV